MHWKELEFTVFLAFMNILIFQSIKKWVSQAYETINQFDMAYAINALESLALKCYSKRSLSIPQRHVMDEIFTSHIYYI